MNRSLAAQLAAKQSSTRISSDSHSKLFRRGARGLLHAYRPSEPGALTAVPDAVSLSDADKVQRNHKTPVRVAGMSIST
ncbi:hypothetical protein NicSoilC5_27880 [Arthrobacter sp. NicSoilC5]|nr:hypothetical protein NicSoilC5_27880 [Arthrobacter sp. NicSoilC5]